MVIQDDRTEAQKMTHTILVIGTDRFMSGWGQAPGTSYAAWACRPHEYQEVKRAIRARSDMRRVRVVDGRTYRPRGRTGDHFHIYVHNGREVTT